MLCTMQNTMVVTWLKYTLMMSVSSEPSMKLKTVIRDVNLIKNNSDLFQLSGYTRLQLLDISRKDMSLNKNKLLIIVVAFSGLAACSGPTPLPQSDCDKIVTHVTKVLGKYAPANSEMNKQCKAATDEARGCAMLAQKPMALSQCDF